ncbi:sulfotransferase family protein [Micromonospora sp. MS34]|uniref:sulfotransferase family protein n=1 Tax=Micromonospora sp. MS34 TaxID=3385971 RepID=UPI0039A35329
MTRVLYITGWCRSGTTVLGNVLGELPGVVHVGELHYLWRNGVLDSGTNSTCGCGDAVARCPLWSDVLTKVAGDDPVAFARSATADLAGGLRTRHTWRRLKGLPSPAGRAVERLAATYQAIAAVTGSRLIIDGSKYPAEAAALLHRPDIDLRVLHMVRDPRATAHSWRRAKAYIPAMGAIRSTAYWVAFNAASDRIAQEARGRYLRLRYEDFVTDPQATLRAVLDLCDLPDEPPVDRAGQVTLGVNHTVTGNPDRLRRGRITLTPDDTWRAELPLLPRLGATTVALPLLRRYGYASWT